MKSKSVTFLVSSSGLRQREGENNSSVEWEMSLKLLLKMRLENHVSFCFQRYLGQPCCQGAQCDPPACTGICPPSGLCRLTSTRKSLQKERGRGFLMGRWLHITNPPPLRRIPSLTENIRAAQEKARGPELHGNVYNQKLLPPQKILSTGFQINTKETEK